MWVGSVDEEEFGTFDDGLMRVHAGWMKVVMIASFVGTVRSRLLLPRIGGSGGLLCVVTGGERVRVCT